MPLSRHVFILGSYILHVIRTQCGPSDAVVYYFRYLAAARLFLPVCFPPLRLAPTEFRRIYAYIFIPQNMRAFFGAETPPRSRAFSVHIEEATREIGLIPFARNKH